MDKLNYSKVAGGASSRIFLDLTLVGIVVNYNVMLHIEPKQVLEPKRSVCHAKDIMPARRGCDKNIILHV